MATKYEFTTETLEYGGRVLKRIIALRDLPGIPAGMPGGWIENETNLSHYGNCWVSGNAPVFDYAWVYGNAQVCGKAKVSGDARVCGKAKVSGDARVCGKAWVYGKAIEFR